MNEVTVTQKSFSLSKLFCFLRVKVQRGITALLTSFFKSKSFKLFGVSSGLAVIQGEEKILFSPLATQRELPSSIEKHAYGVFTKNLTVKHPVSSIIKVSNAIATRSGANLTLDGKIIQQLFEPTDGKTVQDHHYFRFSSKRISPKIRVSAEPVVSLAFQWQGNLYHWLFDTLPKIYLLENAHQPIKRLYVDCEKSFQRESLDLLGIGPDKVIDASHVEALSASELVIPSMPGLIGHPPKWVCNYLRSSFLPFLSKSSESTVQRKKQTNTYGGDRGERIYMIDSSNGESVKHPSLKLLEKYSFTVVDCASLDFLEQIRLFANTEVMISFHQSALSNLVFANPKMKILELFAKREVNPCYWAVANEVSLDYHYLTCASESEERLEHAILSLLENR